MRKAALLYNPLSGRRRERRVKDVEAALAVLQEAGVEANAEPTLGPAAAGDQAREAIAQGCDAILACGGDGRGNDGVQGVVGTGAGRGVIALGTANGWAHDLRLAVVGAAPRRGALAGQRRPRARWRV